MLFKQRRKPLVLFVWLFSRSLCFLSILKSWENRVVPSMFRPLGSWRSSWQPTICISSPNLFLNSGVYAGKQICFLNFWQTRMDCVLSMAKGRRGIVFKGMIYLMVCLRLLRGGGGHASCDRLLGKTLLLQMMWSLPRCEEGSRTVAPYSCF